MSNIPEEKQEEWLQTIGNFSNDEQVVFYTLQFLDAMVSSPDKEENEMMIVWIDGRMDDSDDWLGTIVSVIDFMAEKEEES